MQKKRSAPAPVDPVVHEGVRYEALQWGKARNLGQNGGYVSAHDATFGKELWLQKVYDVTYDGDMEDDKRDVFITSLAISGNCLIVEDERGEHYSLDLKTRKVSKA